VPFNDEIPKYPNTQRNPKDETPNIGTSEHSADSCHGSAHALNQTSLSSSIDLAEDQVEFLGLLPERFRFLPQLRARKSNHSDEELCFSSTHAIRPWVFRHSLGIWVFRHSSFMARIHPVLFVQKTLN